MHVKNFVGQSRRLRAEMFGPDASVRVVIRDVQIEQCGALKKPVMYFQNKERGLVLNVINVQTLSEAFGTDDSEVWKGRTIELYTCMVDFGGKKVLGIRLRPIPSDPRSGSPTADRLEGRVTSHDIRW